MDNAGTIRQCNIAVTGHIVSFFVLLPAKLHRTVKQRLILFIFQFFSGIAGKHLICRFCRNAFFLIFFYCKLTKHSAAKCFCHIISIAVCCFYLDIRLFRIYAECNIGRKRPRSCCPRQNISIFFLYFKPCNRRAFLYVFISLRYLGTRKRRAAAWTVRHNLKSFIQKPFIPNTPQRPPLRLHIVVMVSNIRMLHVCPKANCTGKILPHALVLPDAFFAFSNKRLQAIGFNLILSVDAKQLFYFDFHRKPMSIPARLTWHHISFHRTVSRNHILDNASQHMPDMRLAVCRWRTVIKCICLSLLSGFHALLENAFFLPKQFHGFFSVHKVHVRVYFFVHR